MNVDLIPEMMPDNLLMHRREGRSCLDWGLKLKFLVKLCTKFETFFVGQYPLLDPSLPTQNMVLPD